MSLDVSIACHLAHVTDEWTTRCGHPDSRLPRRLSEYGGHDKARPLLLSIKGRVLNVSEGEEYYGKEGPYKCMAGRDAR